MSDDQLREIFLENGFAIKHGQGDLKPYVYAAGRAIVAAAQADLLSACQSAISHLEWSLTAEDPRCVAMRAAIQKATT